MQVPEDTQPNELRPSHKGRNAVPTIRTSRPLDYRTSKAARTESTAQSGTSTSRWHSNGPKRPFIATNTRPPQRPDNSSLGHAPTHPSREQVIVSERPTKRRRTNDPPHIARWQHNVLKLPLDRSQSKMKSSDPIRRISVPMPPECVSGAPRCTHHRRGWLKTKKRELEGQHGVAVVNQSFEGSNVIFECRSTRISGSRAACASNQANASPVPWPHVNNDRNYTGASSSIWGPQAEMKRRSPSRLINPAVRQDDSRCPERLYSPSEFDPDNFSCIGGPSTPAHRYSTVPCTSPPQASKLRGRLQPEVAPAGSLRNAEDASPNDNDRPSFYAPRPTPAASSAGNILQTTTSTDIALLSRAHWRASGIVSFRSGVLRISPLPTSSLHPARPRESEAASFSDITEGAVKEPASLFAKDRAALSSIGSPRSKSFPDDPQPTPDSVAFCPVPPLHTNSSVGDLMIAVNSLHDSSPLVNEDASLALDGAQSVVLSEETEPVVELVRLTKQSHDKPRRVLVSPPLGILSVTMRGAITLVVHDSPRRGRVIRAASESMREAVDDACLVRCYNEQFMIAAHVREDHQLSVRRVTGDNLKFADVYLVDRPAQPGKNGGASAVCATMQNMMFASGGYDHVVHLWDASEDISRPTPTPLGIKHTSTVQTLLAIRNTSHKLVSGAADCNVHIYDLSSERVVNTLKPSNSVYHVHEALSPFCTLLEVAHRELQFEIRDHRLVPRKPVQRFGYSSQKVQGRYIKGDVHCGTFACGDKDGAVRLWDLRHTERTKNTIPCFTGQRVTQVVFDDARLIVCSEDHELAYIDHRSG